jgi:hypothetical protein
MQNAYGIKGTLILESKARMRAVSCATIALADGVALIHRHMP